MIRKRFKILKGIKFVRSNSGMQCPKFCQLFKTVKLCDDNLNDLCLKANRSKPYDYIPQKYSVKGLYYGPPKKIWPS